MYKQLERAIKRRGWKLIEESEDNAYIIVRVKSGESMNWDKMDNFRLQWGYISWATLKDDIDVVRFRH